jgi:ATP-binding cassette subfamily C (CFTR/MRP) protein 4
MNVLLNLLTAASQLVPTFWLSHWTTQSYEVQRHRKYPLILAGLVLLYAIISFGRSMFIFKSTEVSLRNLLNQVMDQVLHSKIVFFDSNPIGRILTRFTKDVAVFDLLFPNQFLISINGIVRSLAVVITVAVINPWVLIPTFFCSIFMVFVVKLGNRPMTETQRIDALEREPVHNTFSMMITGLVSCRVSNKVAFFKKEFMNTVLRGANATFNGYGISCWMGLRLDLICVVFSSSVTWFCLVMKGKVSGTILLVTL